MIFEKNSLNCSEQDFRNLFQVVWNDLTQDDGFLRPGQVEPLGFVLGGQPGAGKSFLTSKIMEKLNRNMLSISGDDFRPYHPYFEIIRKLYKEEAAQYTAKFSGKMTELLIKKALQERFNVVIEGTFRTATVPLNTLKNLKDAGYRAGVKILICNKTLSWQACQERYEKMLNSNPVLARAVDKAHHDLVVGQLPATIKEVYDSRVADSFEIYERIPDGKSYAIKNIFRSTENLPLEVNKIKNILEGNDFVRKISRDKDFEYGR